MGEVIFGILQLIGLFVGRWLLPRISGGQLIIMPQDAAIHLDRLAPYARLPNGKIGVDADLVGTLLAVSFVVAIVGLCCLIL